MRHLRAYGRGWLVVLGLRAEPDVYKRIESNMTVVTGNLVIASFFVSVALCFAVATLVRTVTR